MDSAFANIPLERPPKGHKANFVNPENLSTVTISVVSFTSLLGVTFVILRVYARAYLRNKPTPDDCEYLELLERSYN